jgi:hypothetical protein
LLKWGTLGSNRLKSKVLREQMGTKNLLKSVALAPGVLKCGAASTPHRRAPPQKGSSTASLLVCSKWPQNVRSSITRNEGLRHRRALGV